MIIILILITINLFSNDLKENCKKNILEDCVEYGVLLIKNNQIYADC